MFGEIICPVGGAGAPENVKLSLMLAVTEPIEVHVHSFGAFLLDSVIGNPAGSVVVSLEWGSQLQVAQFFQGSMDGAEGLDIEEQGA